MFYQYSKLFKPSCQLLVWLSFLFGCGKDFNPLSSGGGNGGGVDPIVVSDKEKIAGEHRIFCESPSKCNESVAKLVVFDQNSKIERSCAGFLVSESTLVTSASCLPKHLRYPFAKCNEDIFIHFPETGDLKREMVKCDSILSTNFVDQTQNDQNELVDQDPSGVVGDFAFIALDKKFEDRKYLSISRQGFFENITNYFYWRLRAENNQISILVREFCRPVYNSYANPFANHQFSPNMVMAGCNFDMNTRGSPVTDSYGFVRGLVHGNVSKEIKDYFESRKLIVDEQSKGEMDKLNFVSNFSCATTPESARLKGDKYSIPSQCKIDLNSSLINERRSKILNDSTIHQSFFEKIPERLRENSDAFKFVRWIVEFDSTGDNSYKARLKPICFLNYNKWSSKIKRKASHSEEFMALLGGVELKFDSTLRAKSLEVNVRSSYLTITFQPKKLKEEPFTSQLELDGKLIENKLGLCQ